MRRLLVALVLALATPAWAQDDDEELTAAPGSIATGMIETAEADGVFELIHNGQVSVRHIGSGMRCDFARDGTGGSLILFPNLPRGDDVACQFEDGRTQTMIYATRYPFNAALAELIAGAEAAILRRYPDAAPYPGVTLIATDDGLPDRRSTRFIATRNGERVFTSASVARVGDWIIKVRYIAPAPDDAAAQQADAMADGLMAGALSDIVFAPAH